jgi:GT2 family glycosyltransferase
MKERNEHSFIVLVYKESPYLVECIESLVNQTVESTIILATSTRRNSSLSFPGKYGLRLSINPQANGIAADWN